MGLCSKVNGKLLINSKCLTFALVPSSWLIVLPWEQIPHLRFASSHHRLSRAQYILAVHPLATESHLNRRLSITNDSIVIQQSLPLQHSVLSPRHANITTSSDSSNRVQFASKTLNSATTMGGHDNVRIFLPVSASTSECTAWKCMLGNQPSLPFMSS